MNFNRVKFKLNWIYTGSLLLILVIFILVLYFFISKAINKQEIEQLERFYKEEEHEFFEEIFENSDEYKATNIAIKSKHHKKEHEHFYDDEDGKYQLKKLKHIEYKPERTIFYYVFDKDFHLLKGEGTLDGFDQYVEKLKPQNSKTTKEINWKKAHVLFTYYPLEINGQNFGSVIIGKDITDEKHLIQKIIWILLFLTGLFSVLFAFAGNFFAGQAMKPILSAFEKQRKFVSDASHELRTPLSVFYSSIDILSREENLSPFGKQVLEDAKQESEMMHKLLDDLLFLARNDQDHFELELEQLNLSILVQSLLNRFKRNMPSHLTLKQNIQDEVLMWGDKVRIEQLLYILLDNAVRYTKEGSITCSLTSQKDKIEISIKDTGVGIAKEDLQHIFERFYRGDSSRKRDGTGLGLSIAKTIVDSHGGRIDVKSEVGKGTEFMISFYKNKKSALPHNDKW